MGRQIRRIGPNPHMGYGPKIAEIVHDVPRTRHILGLWLSFRVQLGSGIAKGPARRSPTAREALEADAVKTRATHRTVVPPRTVV